ncbi:hypothetical protein CsatB_011772 [Cannabis sativa]
MKQLLAWAYVDIKGGYDTTRMKGLGYHLSGTLKTVKDRTANQVTNSKVSRLFAGTQERCVACKKTVYPIKKVKSLVFDVFI